MTVPLVWLIDTSVVPEMIRPRPEAQEFDFLDSIADEGIGLVSVSVWEVLDGIGRFAPGRRRSSLVARFHDLLDELFEDRIVDWTLADALPHDRATNATFRLEHSGNIAQAPSRGWQRRVCQDA